MALTWLVAGGSTRQHAAARGSGGTASETGDEREERGGKARGLRCEHGEIREEFIELIIIYNNHLELNLEYPELLQAYFYGI